MSSKRGECSRIGVNVGMLDGIIGSSVLGDEPRSGL